jgi:hypothetical protein
MTASLLVLKIIFDVSALKFKVKILRELLDWPKEDNERRKMAENKVLEKR